MQQHVSARRPPQAALEREIEPGAAPAREGRGGEVVAAAVAQQLADEKDHVDHAPTRSISAAAA